MDETLSSDDETLDRLSELPDCLILEVLALLDMKDVVKTSLLSKRWKYLWITIPRLSFGEGNANFVNRTLMLWRGTKLRKFKITAPPLKYHDDDMDLWLLYAKDREVEEIRIDLRRSKPLYRPPQSLYECSYMRDLTLYNCELQFPRNFQLYQLKILWIVGACFTEEGVIDQLVSSSPQLHMLYLRFEVSNQDLNIRSSSLTWLKIHSIECDPSRHTVFTISAPRLLILKILGAPPSRCVLTDVSTSLMEATLDVPEKWGAVVGETLSQFLPAIQHVEIVTLSACCFKMIGVMKGKCSFLPFKSVTQLRINGGHIEIFGLVEHFPNLNKLLVDWKIDIEEPFNIAAMEYETNMMLLQLKAVEITWYTNLASIFHFVEILLKHAPAMQKMLLQKAGNQVVESEDMFMAAQQLVSLQRSFPTVELLLRKQKSS